MGKDKVDMGEMARIRKYDKAMEGKDKKRERGHRGKNALDMLAKHKQKFERALARYEDVSELTETYGELSGVYDSVLDSIRKGSYDEKKVEKFIKKMRKTAGVFNDEEDDYERHEDDGKDYRKRKDDEDVKWHRHKFPPCTKKCPAYDGHKGKGKCCAKEDCEKHEEELPSMLRFMGKKHKAKKNKAVKRYTGSERRLTEMWENRDGVDPSQTMKRLEQIYNEEPMRYEIIMELFRDVPKLKLSKSMTGEDDE